MNKKWKKIKSVDYKTDYRKISKVTYKLPDSTIKDFDIIIGPEVSCVFALTKDKKVIVAKQFRPGPEKTLWELPGGMVDKGENEIKAATRELLEETGYKGRIKYLGKCYTSAYNTTIIHSFLVTDCQLVAEQKLDHGEFIEVELVSIDFFKKILKSGNLTDSITGYKALEYLKLLH